MAFHLARAATPVDRGLRWASKRKPLVAAVGAAAVMSVVALVAIVRGGGGTRIVERVIVERDASAELSAAALEIERKAADFRFDEAVQAYVELIDRRPDPAGKEILRQRLEDLRLQQAVLAGLVERIRKEARDYSPFRLKSGPLDPVRVLDATSERIIIRHAGKFSEHAWSRVEPRQFAALVKDYWPDLSGRPALGFGVWCLRQGLVDEAAFAFQRQAAPEAKRYLEELSTARAKDISSAPSAKEPPPAPKPAVYDDAIRRGNEKRAAKDHAGAIGEYSIALAERRDDPHALHLRACSQFDLKEYPAAVSDCTTALLGTPGGHRLPLLGLRARARLGMGDVAEALVDFDEAILLDPGSASLRRDRGTVHYTLRRYDRAIADFSRAIELEPGSGADAHRRGLCHYDTGNWKQAAADYRKATQLGSWNTDYAWIGLWTSRARLGEQAAASRELKAYAEGRPGPKEAWFRKIALFLAGEIPEDLFHAYAVEPLDERERREAQCEAFYYAATKRALAGDAAGAESLFKKCVETGVTAFTEYLGALSELEALAGKRPAGQAAAAPVAPPPEKAEPAYGPAAEYTFSWRAMAPGGSFEAERAPDGKQCLQSTRAAAGREVLENHVEFAFVVEAGKAYRCWVLVGGCCAETLECLAQASDYEYPDPTQGGRKLKVDPGAPAAYPVKVYAGGLPKMHAHHGGARRPVAWKWAPVELPAAYATGGAKRIRILSESEGFAIRSAVVSSTRTAPPTGNE